MYMKTKFEPFKIKSIEHIPLTKKEDREKYLKESFYNPFYLKSDVITIDLLTDSGTTAMSSKQWAALMDGDESYAGSKSYYKFEDKVREITGFKYILPTHQGRAAERIFFAIIGGKGKHILNNTHFDTTRGNIEYTGAKAVDFVTEIGKRPDVVADFKGNIDLVGLKNYIEKS